MAGRSVRMQDVASAAGVSCATVSLALREDSRLPVATRRRLQRLADEMGYRPNPLVSALMTQIRTTRPAAYRSVLAFGTSLARADDWKDDRMQSRLFNGARERAAQLGYALQPCWLKNPRYTAQTLSAILRERGVQGIVVAPVPRSHGRLAVQWRDFAAVTLGYSLLKPGLPRVCNHQFHTIVMALRHLRRLRYRRVGLAVHALNNERVDRNWTAGYFTYNYNLERDDTLLLSTRLWNREVFIRWLTSVRPEAVISPHQEVWDWIESIGWEMPRDVGFVCLDWSSQLGDCAGVDQEHEKLGALAVEAVVSQIQRHETSCEQPLNITLVEGVWKTGSTIIPK